MPDLSQAVPTKDLKEWHLPSSRTEAIDTLIHGVGTFKIWLEVWSSTDCVERYNPLQLPMMEDYLREQIEQGEQDFMANLAVLKL
jgi:translation initiation factor 3 subunit K